MKHKRNRKKKERESTYLEPSTVAGRPSPPAPFCRLPPRARRQRAWPPRAGTRPATSSLLACIPDGLDVSMRRHAAAPTPLALSPRPRRLPWLSPSHHRAARRHRPLLPHLDPPPRPVTVSRRFAATPSTSSLSHGSPGALQRLHAVVPNLGSPELLAVD